MEFDAQFKFAKIQNSHFVGGGVGSRNLMLSSNLLKSKNSHFVGGGGGGGGGLVEPISNFWCWVQIC